MPAITANAPGKTILFGEHAVVYGYPAIAVPISSIRTKVIIQPSIESRKSTVYLKKPEQDEVLPFDQIEKGSPVFSAIFNLEKHLDIKLPAFKLTISSSIPISAGLGSSAAIAVAIVRGMSEFCGYQLSNVQINEIAYQSEIIQHGTPSGIDNSVITYETPVYFSKGEKIQPIELTKDIHLVLADSGQRALTKDVVAVVREKRNKQPERIDGVLQKIGGISTQAKQFLSAGDEIAVGSLMTENHQALKALDISTDKLNTLVGTAIQAGALGAKVCGGGKGGFMVSLCKISTVENVCEHLSAISPRVIKTTIKKGSLC